MYTTPGTRLSGDAFFGNKQFGPNGDAVEIFVCYIGDRHLSEVGLYERRRNDGSHHHCQTGNKNKECLVAMTGIKRLFVSILIFALPQSSCSAETSPDEYMV